MPLRYKFQLEKVSHEPMLKGESMKYFD